MPAYHQKESDAYQTKSMLVDTFFVCYAGFRPSASLQEVIITPTCQHDQILHCTQCKRPLPTAQVNESQVHPHTNTARRSCEIAIGKTTLHQDEMEVARKKAEGAPAGGAVANTCTLAGGEAASTCGVANRRKTWW